MAYNLGTEDIKLMDRDVKVDDGKYHVLRFTRSGPNSTLQIDDNKVRSVSPNGELKMEKLLAPFELNIHI